MAEPGTWNDDALVLFGPGGVCVHVRIFGAKVVAMVSRLVALQCKRTKLSCAVDM